MRAIYRLLDVLTDATGLFLPFVGGGWLWYYWSAMTIGERLIGVFVLVLAALVVVAIDRLDAVAQEYVREREARLAFAKAVRKQAEIEASAGTDLPGRSL